MDKVTHIPVVELNHLLTCHLCKGYIIDATTVVECLHSFCKTCIINYLDNHNTCPVCDTLLHKTRPQCAIRSDYAMQAIVYKLLPKVFDREMASRRNFYNSLHPEERGLLSPEKRGDISLNAYVEKEEERVSIELSLWRDRCGPAPPASIQSTTYLLCPPSLTVGHLEKLVRLKFDLPPTQHAVEFFFSENSSVSGGERFTSEFTLSDLVCIYSCTHSWVRAKRNGYIGGEPRPMKLFFSVLPISPKAVETEEEEAITATSAVATTATAVASNPIALSTG
ncbi:Polycomb complex protein BMI-1-A [Taenia crassiceps]|uniref:Polycomb complex protein BMI-1-A n=1 Tax=Taenia crassiceps TaxID=6207 RepID=A0ABR4Q0E9_9CEST